MEKYIEHASFEGTGFSYTMSLISGKHKMVILYCLMEFEPVRFNEMKRYVGKITDKTLSSNLKALEADGLIVRKNTANSAQSGIFAVGARKVFDESAGPAVPVGRKKTARRAVPNGRVFKRRAPAVCAVRRGSPAARRQNGNLFCAGPLCVL